MASSLPGLESGQGTPPSARGRRDVPGERRSSLLLAVAEQARGDVAQYWMPPLVRRPVQMMISVRGGTELPDVLQQRDRAPGLAPALRRGLVAGQRRMSPSAMALSRSMT